MNQFKSSKLSRLAKLTKSVAVATTGYVFESAKEKAMIRATSEIIKSMGELKGAVMKIGQMISITDDLLLPKEVTELFKKLQKDAPPMANVQVDQVFRKSFGKLPREMFKEFSYTPIASASIGQVHKATTLEGDIVAVKVQYPEIANAIKSDLSNIEQIKKIFSLILPKNFDIQEMIEELRDNFLEECDYEIELKNMEEFRKLLASEFPQIYIPKTYKGLSSKSIICTEFVSGDNFDQTLNYTQEQRDFLGKTLYESFLYLLFQKRRLHTDPQNGNYLFNPNQIIMLDFGSTKEFTAEFIKSWWKLCDAVEKDDFNTYRDTCFDLGFGHENTSTEFIQNHFELSKNIYAPFLKPGKYAPKDLNPLGLIKDFVFKNKLKDASIPNKQFLLLDRANIGLFTKLIAWRSEVDWGDGRRNFQILLDHNI